MECTLGAAWPALAIGLLCLLPAGRLLGQSGMERVFSEMQNRLHLLEQENRTLTAASDSLAHEIQLLKSREPLNFFERRRLESALRDAQALGSRREDTLRNQATLRSETARLAVLLDEYYGVQIDSLLREADRATALQRQEITLQAERLRSRRAAIQFPLTTTTSGVPPAGAITIKSTDLPEEIDAKAVLLRVREEQFRRQVRILERRTGQVRQENALRKKMTDLMTDVALFEQRDETAQIASRNMTSDRTTGAESVDKGRLDFGDNSPAAPDMASPADHLLHVDIRTLSAEDTDQLLRELEGQRRILLQRADSLANQAEKFEGEADSLRAILRQKR
jgi:hypothetical protein